MFSFYYYYFLVVSVAQRFGSSSSFLEIKQRKKKRGMMNGRGQLMSRANRARDRVGDSGCRVGQGTPPIDVVALDGFASVAEYAGFHPSRRIA